MRVGAATLSACGLLLLEACLFPSLDALSNTDAGFDATADAPPAADSSAADALADGGVAESSVADADSDAFVATLGCTGAQPDLVAYYTFDEDAGSAVHDCVSVDNLGNVLNVAHSKWVGTSKHGNALELDTVVNGCAAVEFPTPTFAFGGVPKAAPFTVAMWIELTALPGSSELGFVAGFASDINQAGWRFAVTPTGAPMLTLPAGDGGVVDVTGPTLSVGTYHHLAVVYAGATTTIYVDGVAGAPTKTPTGFAVDQTTGDHMRIGCSSDDDHPLTARVDEARFYDRALDAAEVLTVMNAQ